MGFLMKMKIAFGIILGLLIGGLVGYAADENASVIPEPAIAKDPIEDEVVETESGFYYTVKQGDTLWDLSERFADSPYYWPDLWSDNNQIKNPHLIYPGQRIRLYRRSDIERYREPEPVVEEEVVEEFEPEPEPEPVVETPPPSGGTFRYARIDKVGFVRDMPAEVHGTIFKVRQPKEMISSGDIVYIRPQNDAILIPGTRYTIYRIIKPVLDPLTKKNYGYQHYILGVLEITQNEEKYVIGRVIASYGGIKISDNIMPYLRRSPIIDRTAPQPELTGKIIMAEERNSVIGDNVTAFIDKGQKHGVKPGQRYSIFYQESGNLRGGSRNLTKLDLVDYGELIVLHTEQDTSTVYITRTQSNISPGALIRTPFQ